MPIETLIKEATDLPDEYINMAVTYIQFLQFQYEKKKRKQDLKRAESVLSAMRDAGLKPVKSVSETAEILRKRWD